MFNRLKFLIPFLFLFQFFLPFFGNSAIPNGGGVNTCAIDCGNINNIWSCVEKTDIRGISTFLGALTGYVKTCIVRPAFMGVIVVAGFYIMASLDNPGNVQKGKFALIVGIIGLSIVSLADEIKGGAVAAIVFGIIIIVLSSVVK